MKIGNTLRRSAVAAVVLAAAGYGLARLYFWYSASEGMDRIAAMARPYAGVSWDSVSADVAGTINVHDLRVRFRGLDDDLTVQRLTVRGRDIRSLGDLAARLREGDLPDSLKLAASGVRIRVDGPIYRTLLRQSGGRLWGTPLDDVACQGKPDLDTRVLSALDMNTLHMNLELGMRVRRPARRMALFLNMAIEQVAATKLDAYFQLPADAEGDGLRYTEAPDVVSLQIHYTDQGFNESRNYVCAAEQDVPVTAFIDRHVAAVRALYANAAGPPDESLLDRYREYATYGGDLRLTLEPASPIGISRLSELDRRLFVDTLRPRLVVNGRSVNVSPEQWLPPTPSPAADAPQRRESTAAGKPAPPTFQPARPADLVAELGATVRVTTAAGKTYTGVVAQADDQRVVVREALKGGSVGYTVAMSDIAQVEVLR